jgi:hypothetical protein
MEIIKIDEEDVLLSIVIRQIRQSSGTEFFTNPEQILQVGLIHVSPDRQVLRHRHNSLERKTLGTSEVLLVLDGKVKLEVFSVNSDALIKSIDLFEGDLVVLIAGGHSFSSEIKSAMLEVKNGPYDLILDKVYF